MRLVLQREASHAGATVGRLSVDGRFECYVLEDVVREVPGQAVYTWKIAGQTAIPAGDYAVVINQSVRFKRRLPLLVGVPGFAGIRIHPGNRAQDTEGCLLPGRTRGIGTVGQSRVAFNALFAQLEAAADRHEPITLTILNAPAAGAAALAKAA